MMMTILLSSSNHIWKEQDRINENKPVGGRDHEMLGMGSFGEYTQLYGN
jgi:hypothetical protein